MASSQVSGQKFSGAHGERTINSMHMAVWAIVMAVIAVPTVPMAFGYLFGSLSIVFASVVIGRRTTQEVGQGPLIIAWIAAAISTIAMLGYIVYMLAESPNYL